MILLWGVPDDGPLASVRQALLRRGAPVAFLDQRAVLDTTLELGLGEQTTGMLRVGREELGLATVTSVYVRPYEYTRIPTVEKAGPGSVEWHHAFNVQHALFGWLEVTPAFVVNRPARMASNASKPYQLAIIAESGFAVPATLVTTDWQAAVDFRQHHGEVVYKSVSGIRSIVARLTDEHLDRLKSALRWCPTQFQEYVAGTDYRVHVVGDDVFASEIVSSEDDYRNISVEECATQISPYRLSEECETLCQEMARAMGLPVAGIDLRRTPDGIWYCFEVNSSPGFTYFQERSGQPIDEAVAQLLIGVRVPSQL